MVTRTAPHAFIEALESRIAPAVVISPGGNVARYTDLDGDRVTITVSKGRLTASDFVMSSEGATVPGGEKLVMLDFSDDLGEFHRANLTIVASPTRLGGDGAADVGFVNAADGMTDFGRVKIDGVLERMVAGDADDGPRSPGVRLLIAHDFEGSGTEVIGGIATIVNAGAPEVNAGSEIVQRVGVIALTGNNTPPSGVIVATGASPGVQPADSSGVTFTGGLVKTGAGALNLSAGTGTVSGGTLQISNPSTVPGAPSNVTQSVGSVSSGYGAVILQGIGVSGSGLVARGFAGFSFSAGTLIVNSTGILPLTSRVILSTPVTPEVPSEPTLDPGSAPIAVP